MTMSSIEIDNALQNIQKYASRVTGASILGVHLEGPFLNTSKHGVQDKAYIQVGNFPLIEKYMTEIKMITIAPEVEGNESFIKKMSRMYPDVILSIGHSNASYEKSRESFVWGVSHATHLFNAMHAYHHRTPGIVGAVFDTDVTCDIIADLVHMHPHMLTLVYTMKREKVILITDAMRAGCMKSGRYDLGGRVVNVSKNKALLEDGTLAGSVLKMNEALQNMVSNTHMNLIEAVYAVTVAPAEKLKIKKGKLKTQYDADIVIFDEDFSIITTIIEGKIKYRRK